ncbi:archaeal DNA polymerase I [Chloriridovirus anopheles1]|uniref:DNA-directed DNA polymerase n=1 Tax=Chloriridovirus anopheles1 TaxID=1465751 RepID=W8QF12_9VIRU|nr:archaeal DNA polymerase I [Anopheles minimus iridovirus]AHL67544.1 archaeal DNA polymerase I [Anopheles minimus iridovirus]
MATLQTIDIYAYSWHIDEEEQDSTFIRVYGLNNLNENICVSINGFRPHVYVELPTHINWVDFKPQLYSFFQQLSSGLKCTLTFARKLYGANLKKKDEKFVHKKFPFLKCTFNSKRDAHFLAHKLKNRQYVPGIGQLKFNVHHLDACPRLQLTSKYNLPTAGWIRFKGTKILQDEDKFTERCDEFMIDLSDKRYKPEDLMKRCDAVGTVKPLILSFDLEVNSEDGITMPKATRPGDVVFQISCVFSRLGEPAESFDKYLLSLGNPSPELVGAKVLSYPSESKLLMGFTNLIKEKNPNCIIGYNIFSFDIPYLMDRANYKHIYPEWSVQGFPRDRCGISREIKWSSSAYKNQEFKYLDCEGRLYIDLLPIVQRDFKLNDYKLKTVSTQFIGETKDDLDAKGIFKCYREGIKNTSVAYKYMSVCGKYCMQDSLLVTKLFDKLNVWHGLSEMAAVCNVPMITLFTKGQQVKVYSQVYKHCVENKIVVEKDGYVTRENERYVGAFVFPPKPGLYENVVPMDFSSLYPSLIIAYNIDYSTLAADPHIPDEMCHVMEWEDHISCKHDPKVIEKARLTKLIDELVNKKGYDKALVSKYRKERSEITKSLNKNVMCEKRRYRFLDPNKLGKESVGVLPTIIQNLLEARKNTRKEIVVLKDKLKTTTNDKEKINLETTISVLNQRQLAYKVSANSMYGITGVKAGMLPCMPIAMSVTFMGRTNILKAAKYLQEIYGGFLVYGDTDSNYVSFNHKNFSYAELWDYALKVADEVSSLFPPPMRLEFEEAIYKKFLILTKKRYMYQTCLRNGSIKPEIGKRGVILNRRDNSGFIRNIYEKMVKIIFEEDDPTRLQTRVLHALTNDINNMFCGAIPVQDFVITKSTGDYGNLEPQFFLNEKGLKRAMLGQYNVPFLTDEAKMEEEITNEKQEKEWYLSKLPAHIQLLEKIKRRGQIKNEGSRLEYVILETNDHKDKQCVKIEALDYYLKNKDVLKLDYLYYLQRCINPIDQILEVLFKLPHFTKQVYDYHFNKKKLIGQMNLLFAPTLNIDKTNVLLYRDLDKYYIQLGQAADNNTLHLVAQFQTTEDTKNLYLKLRHKCTKLKTKFTFKCGYIKLNGFAEQKLISALKRLCKA